MELLRRTTRSVVPTEAGELVAGRARAVLAETDALRGDIDSARPHARARERRSDAVRRRARHPGGDRPLHLELSDVEVGLREGTAQRMLEMLSDGSLDVAFALEVRPPDGVQRLSLSSEELAVATSTSHPLAGDKPLADPVFGGDPADPFQRGSSTRQVVDAALARAGVRPAIALEANDFALFAHSSRVASAWRSSRDRSSSGPARGSRFAHWRRRCGWPSCCGGAEAAGVSGRSGVGRSFRSRAARNETVHHPLGWCWDGRVDAVSEAERSEKITINLGLIDLGQIDLLVSEGFFTNRTDFIRTAIRRQLESRSEAVARRGAPRPGAGDRALQPGRVEHLQASGQMVELRVLGLATIADGVSPSSPARRSRRSRSRAPFGRRRR